MTLRYWLSGYNILFFGILGVVSGIYLQDLSLLLKPMGDVFIQSIRMLIVPIIIFSILNSTSSLTETNKAGAIGILAIVYFFITSVVAVFLGIIVGDVFQVGIGLDQLPQALMQGGESLYSDSDKEIIGFWTFLLNIIPLNPIEAVVKGNILQILVFVVFLGIAVSYIDNQHKESFLKTVSLLNDSLLWMMGKVMYLAPLGVFALSAYSIGVMGIEVILLMLKFFFVYLVTALFFVYVLLGIVVQFFSKVSYLKFFKSIIPLKIISFTTASSLVSLPTNIRNCNDMGLDKNISNFVLPVGATINMNGNAMFYAMSAVFFAQIFNIEISTFGYVAIAITSIVGAVGTAGVPGPTLLIIAVLVSAGIPLEGIPLLFAADRLFDMVRTTVNVVGDASAVAVLDKYFGNSKNT